MILAYFGIVIAALAILSSVDMRPQLPEWLILLGGSLAGFMLLSTRHHRSLVNAQHSTPHIDPLRVVHISIFLYGLLFATLIPLNIRHGAKFTVELLTAGLVEEISFRLLPVILLITVAPTRRFGLHSAAFTSALFFTLYHDTYNSLATAEKMIFATSAFYICAATRSAIIPTLLHLVGNATAIIWLDGRSESLAAAFAVASITMSTAVARVVTFSSSPHLSHIDEFRPANPILAKLH